MFAKAGEVYATGKGKQKIRHLGRFQAAELPTPSGTGNRDAHEISSKIAGPWAAAIAVRVTLRML
jgi:hypothetical protein